MEIDISVLEGTVYAVVEREMFIITRDIYK